MKIYTFFFSGKTFQTLAGTMRSAIMHLKTAHPDVQMYQVTAGSIEHVKSIV